ncbi:MAG: glycerol-3-phosphate 1-O-acyltransferase PlsY [Gemmatimonadota bacterium]|nr:glycerol-3-phosphate 1-O-acyltransferase PlsY [Gemmatimonadota bacterium]
MNYTAALLVVAAYLVGSFPTAYLVGKANGLDLRTVGSGNLGATNVLRSVGWRAGLLVYVVDMLKGTLPVALFPAVASVQHGWPWGVVFGIAAIFGHVRPVFLMGKGGGKGVATASGVFLALAPVPALVAFFTFVIVTAISRYASLGSLTGAVVLVAAMFIVTALVAAFVFYTHRANIGRLRMGTESKIGRRVAPAASGEVATGQARTRPTDVSSDAAPEQKRNMPTDASGGRA